jgi:signal transduction histidine kinase
VGPSDDAAGTGDGVSIEIAVEDTGIGLSQEDMQGLFTEFEQAETAIRRRNGGTGLGLAISMQLARAMGREICVASAPGNGSTFTVGLVLKQALSSPPTTPADRHGRDRTRSARWGACSSRSIGGSSVAR